MKIIPKENLPDFFLPLPIYSAIHVADAIGKDGEEFDLFIGLEKKYIEQLKQLSLDERDAILQNNTGDRARFGEGSYEDWYAKNRTPFCLIHKRTDALAALVWIGPKTLGKKSIKFGQESNEKEKTKVGDNWQTISCRAYPPFRGKGHMKNFIKFVLDVYKNKFPNSKFWLGVDNRNKIALRLFSGLEFEIDEENSILLENWLIMVKK